MKKLQIRFKSESLAPSELIKLSNKPIKLNVETSTESSFIIICPKAYAGKLKGKYNGDGVKQYTLPQGNYSLSWNIVRGDSKGKGEGKLQVKSKAKNNIIVGDPSKIFLDTKDSLNFKNFLKRTHNGTKPEAGTTIIPVKFEGDYSIDINLLSNILPSENEKTKQALDYLNSYAKVDDIYIHFSKHENKVIKNSSKLVTRTLPSGILASKLKDVWPDIKSSKDITNIKTLQDKIKAFEYCLILKSTGKVFDTAKYATSDFKTDIKVLEKQYSKRVPSLKMIIDAVKAVKSPAEKLFNVATMIAIETTGVTNNNAMQNRLTTIYKKVLGYDLITDNLKILDPKLANITIFLDAKKVKLIEALENS